jgi:hypothetical protein
MNKTSVAQQAKASSFLPPAQGLLQRKCACGNHTVAGGECSECAKKKSGLQRKLAIGASNDPLEREADRIADQVMAASASTGVGAAPPHIQRYASQATEGTETAPASVDRVISSSGRPLEPTLRQDMEQRFGYDFSRVRVHSGAAAEQSARDVSANAYTVGHSIVFGAGQFAPGTNEGRRLIAHELTHVGQQGMSSIPGELRINTGENSFSELEAKRPAQVLGTSESKVEFGVQPRFSSRALQRKVIPENVSCRKTGIAEFNLTGDEAVAAIQAADQEAIELATGAENLLRDRLFLARKGEHPPLSLLQEQDPRNPRRPVRESVSTEFDTLLQEELGLTLTDPAHFPLIQQQINRFRRVRETLESGYLRYICLALGTVPLVGCSPGDACKGDRASGFSCPGNRLVGLCRPFWFDEFARARTILHEPFHIWFTMARHAPNALKRADASCFEAFALRVAGKIPWRSCADHTAE